MFYPFDYDMVARSGESKKAAIDTAEFITARYLDCMAACENFEHKDYKSYNLLLFKKFMLVVMRTNGTFTANSTEIGVNSLGFAGLL